LREQIKISTATGANYSVLAMLQFDARRKAALPAETGQVFGTLPPYPAMASADNRTLLSSRREQMHYLLAGTFSLK
jgi:hypothetical protein